jgi:hypothetical protein
MDIDPKAAQAMVTIATGNVELLRELDARELQTKAAAALVPNVVDTLVKCGYITNEQRQKAAQSLREPAKVLDTLQRIALSTAVKSAEAEKAALGESSTPRNDTKPTVKAAEVMVGARSPADEKFLRDFGL